MVGINYKLQLENCIADAIEQSVLVKHFETQRSSDSNANNPEALLNRINNFLVVSPPKFDLLEQQLIDADFDASRATLRSFIVYCDLVGAGRLVPCCLQLESVFHEVLHQPSLCRALLSMVKEEYTLLVQTLTQIAEIETILVEHHILRRQWRTQNANVR